MSETPDTTTEVGRTIEQRIADLEDENADIRELCEHLSGRIDANWERIREIEAENDELSALCDALYRKVDHLTEQLEMAEEKSGAYRDGPASTNLEGDAPESKGDPKMETRDEKLVYVIAHPNGYYKIGVSKNPANRLKQLQTATPYQLTLHGLFQSNAPQIAEQAIHHVHDDYRVRGEWFDLPAGALADIEDICGFTGQALARRLKDDDERRRDNLTRWGLVG